jgi:enamidase
MKTAIINLGKNLTGDWRDPVASGDTILMSGGKIEQVGTASADQAADCDVVVDGVAPCKLPREFSGSGN